MKVLAAPLLCALAFCPAVGAAAPYVPIYQAMPPRALLKRPVAELKKIAYMAGTWRCHTYAFATGKVPAHDYGYTMYTGTFIMRNVLNGQRQWLQLVDERERDLSFITYDPMARQWVVTGIEWPVSYGVSTGTMRANQLIVGGNVTVFGRNYRLRTSYVKHSNDSFSLINEEQRPDGTWLRDDEYDFVRVRKP